MEAVADVRRFPTSRFEHFRQQNLERLLTDSGIAYIYLGDELGGYRRGGYQHFTATPEFGMGIERLERAAIEQKVAIVCAERLPWRCHRRFIAGELERRDWQVIHIIDQRQDWIPTRRLL